MRIPKSLVVICVAVAGVVGSLHAQRADTDLQLKAREELRQKLDELNAQPPSAAPDPTPVAPPKKAKRVKAPQVVTPPIQVAPAAPIALTPAPVPVAPVAPVAPAVAAPVAVSYTADAEAKAKAEELVRQKMAELDAQEKANMPAPQAPVVKAKVKSAPAAQAFPEPTPPVVNVEPASSAAFTAPLVAGSKEARLAGLLQRYKADQITPQEYHAQRAQILAEP